VPHPLFSPDLYNQGKVETANLSRHSETFGSDQWSDQFDSAHWIGRRISQLGRPTSKMYWTGRRICGLRQCENDKHFFHLFGRYPHTTLFPNTSYAYFLFLGKRSRMKVPEGNPYLRCQQRGLTRIWTARPHDSSVLQRYSHKSAKIFLWIDSAVCSPIRRE
jgi:hypothetical protein